MVARATENLVWAVLAQLAGEAEPGMPVRAELLSARRLWALLPQGVDAEWGVSAAGPRHLLSVGPTLHR